MVAVALGCATAESEPDGSVLDDDGLSAIASTFDRGLPPPLDTGLRPDSAPQPPPPDAAGPNPPIPDPDAAPVEMMPPPDMAPPPPGMAVCDDPELCNGYSLTVIEDAAEDAFVYGQISQRGFVDTWVGLNDRQQEGVWVWLDGVAPGNLHWDAGEPNDGGGEDCGLIMTSPARRATKWDDRPCERGYAYVRETR